MERTLFCPMCFADERGGSWGAGVARIAADTTEGSAPPRGYCLNCGCGGLEVELPASYVDDIRRNASFVGTRYYPSEEDRQFARELAYLRELACFRVAPPAGRKARKHEPDPDGKPNRYWSIEQQLIGDPRGTMTSIGPFEADSAEEALAIAVGSVPYPVPKDWKPRP